MHIHTHTHKILCFKIPQKIKNDKNNNSSEGLKLKHAWNFLTCGFLVTLLFLQYIVVKRKKESRHFKVTAKEKTFS